MVPVVLPSRPRVIQARCGSCREMTAVTHQSKYCSLCSKSYAVDVEKFMLRQDEADSYRHGRTEAGFYLVMLSSMALGFGPFFWTIGQGLNFWGVCLVVGSMLWFFVGLCLVVLFVERQLKRSFPDLYKNPDWDPD